MVNERIQAIYEAAVRLFLQQGYSRTQISHIAKAVGVSVGTIYHDFTGKEEIMHFILKCTIEPEFMNQEFKRPITSDLFQNLWQDIMTAFETSAASFSESLKGAALHYGFENLISDAFDLLWRYAAGCLFIEKNYIDCGPLADSYQVYRRKFYEAMVNYMKIFIDKGVLRPLKHLELSTHLIIEILTWWTMDMRYTSFETLNISKEQAKEVCMDNIISAYQK